jgi:hypothetical protein
VFASGISLAIPKDIAARKIEWRGGYLYFRLLHVMASLDLAGCDKRTNLKGNSLVGHLPI